MNYVNVKRHGGMGDVIMVLCIAKQLNDHGYKIRYSTTPSLIDFIKNQPYIDDVIDTRITDGLDFDGIEHDERFNKNRAVKNDPASTAFISYTNFTFPNLNIQKDLLNYDIQYPLEFKEKVLNCFSSYPKPWILLNTMASASNRSLPMELNQQIQTNYNGPGTIFWLGNRNLLEKNNIVTLLGPGLFEYIAAIDCCDALITTNTSSLHLGFAFNKTIISIEQSWKAIDYAYNTKSNIISVSVDLDCLGCNFHNGCKIENNEAFLKLWDFQGYPKCSHIPVESILNAINKI